MRLHAAGERRTVEVRDLKPTLLMNLSSTLDRFWKHHQLFDASVASVNPCFLCLCIWYCCVYTCLLLCLEHHKLGYFSKIVVAYPPV